MARQPLDWNWSKPAAAVCSIGLVLVILSPIVQNWAEDPHDDFPLSYYPMFSRKRGETTRISYVVGFDAAGNRTTIRHKHAGTGGLNQVRRQIKRMVRKNRAAELCPSIVDNLLRSKRERYADVIEVQIITGKFRFDDYMTGNKEPLEEQVRARCPVDRGRS